MLVMGRHLLEFILQRSQARHAVHELPRSIALVMDADMVNDGRPHRLIDAPREVEGQVAVVQTPGPRVLIVYPDHLAGLADHATNTIEEDRLAVREVVEEEPDGPLARPVGERQLGFTERELPYRFVAGALQLAREISGGGHVPA
jgi:hypothetical protein